MRGASFIASVVPVLVAGMSLACEPLPPHLIKDPWIQKYDNCSFSEGQYGFHGPFSGGPAINIENGRVAQKLTAVYDSGLCGVEKERLLVIDCTSGRDVIFEGRSREANNPDSGTEIRSIQPPNGPIALRPNTTLDVLIAAARRADIDYAENAARGLVASTKRRNRFDPYCGCKLYYPDSPGAEK